jgi:hypothetical protein
MKHILDDDFPHVHKLESGVEIPFTDAERYSFYESIAVAHKNGYQQQRAAEYPAIGDQLDALWKGGEAAAEMLAKVQAVKAKYPKPTE